MRQPAGPFLGGFWTVFLVVLVGFLFGCQAPIEFRTVSFVGVEYDRVFQICHEAVRRHYSGVYIRADSQGGRIETDPIEFSFEGQTRREQVYVHLQKQEQGAVEVSVMVPIQQRVINLDDDQPFHWQVFTADFKAETILLEEIQGDVIHSHPDADVHY
jgi:hypothetical protein